MATNSTKDMDDQAIAAYIGDMLSGLIILAHRGRMPTLRYLLGVAQLEAKSAAREDRRGNVRLQHPTNEGKQGVKIMGVKRVQPDQGTAATEIVMTGKRRTALNLALADRQLTKFAKPGRESPPALSGGKIEDSTLYAERQLERARRGGQSKVDGTHSVESG